MIIYVKDNVERIAGDEETAKKLESKGYKPVKRGEPVVPTAIPTAPAEKPSVEATKSVQRRRRIQRSRTSDVKE